MSTLETAILIATSAHAGDKDKGVDAYILHPLRVMFKMKTLEAQIAAVLHDIAEDTEWTLSRLRYMGFTETVIDSVDTLTKRSDESYDEFIQRVRTNPLSRQVKIADLEDNLDLSRIPEPTRKDLERVEKYKQALIFLRLE